jgi:hypothetical protein
VRRQCIAHPAISAPDQAHEALPAHQPKSAPVIENYRRRAPGLVRRQCFLGLARTGRAPAKLCPRRVISEGAPAVCLHRRRGGKGVRRQHFPPAHVQGGAPAHIASTYRLFPSSGGSLPPPAVRQGFSGGKGRLAPLYQTALIAMRGSVRS